MSDLKFKIDAQSESAATTRVKARNFEIIVDEPEALGGTDVAPNPVEYVLASFAGCLNVMGHLVAQEMGFELKNLKMEIEGNLNPAKLFGKSDAERAGYKNITIKLIPETEADDTILEKWMHAVESRCPVSDNLQNITPVTVELENYYMAS
ncbi:MAG: OsmC family protein [Bacteroidales bacterium]|nr:OsmC family protein [Bacteroidales bacterium]